MATRKFKTVAGYLRSWGERLARVEPNSDAERALERQIINNLLPQIGMSETIVDGEMPRDGIARIRKLTTDPAKCKALDACRKWLGRMKIISVSVIPQVRTASGLVSYHVHGFRRGDTKTRVSVVVDADEHNAAGRSPHEIAEEIAGTEYCFHSCMNINALVPDGAKNRLFMSDDELYAAVPQLKPPSLRRATR